MAHDGRGIEKPNPRRAGKHFGRDRHKKRINNKYFHQHYMSDGAKAARAAKRQKRKPHNDPDQEEE